MPVPPLFKPAITAKQVTAHGVYLEDGQRLWRVLDADEGHVKLENCKAPDVAVWLEVQEVLQTMKLVRTS